MDEKNNVSAEELAAEQAALQVSKEDEVRADIINEFGFDESVDAEKIDKLVAKEIEHSKKISQAIGQKIKWRTEANKPKGNTPPQDNKGNANITPENKTELKSSELGYAEKAYLQGNDIRGNEEFAVIQKYLKDTGKPLDELVDETSVVGKIIRSEIKEMREAKVTAEAVPKGTKRSSSSTRDSVDYWVKKDLSEVPQEMKIAVVNRRIELEKDKNRSPYSPPIM